MRAYLKEHKADTLLTVRNLPAGASVRLAVMDRFDGNVWNLSNTRIAGGSSDYTRMGLRIPQDGDDSGTRFNAMFDVRDGMHDDWLPLAGAATQVSLPPTQMPTISTTTRAPNLVCSLPACVPDLSTPKLARLHAVPVMMRFGGHKPHA